MNPNLSESESKSPESLRLINCFSLSIGAACGAYALLAVLRPSYLLSLGFNKQDFSKIRSLGLFLTLLLNTPLSAYADRINRRLVLNMGRFLQLIVPIVYFYVSQHSIHSKHGWLALALVYFILELGKYATHDSLASISMTLFSKQASSKVYGQYLYLVQRQIIFFASCTSCLTHVMFKTFGAGFCFFVAFALFVYAQIILPTRALFPKESRTDLIVHEPSLNENMIKKSSSPLSEAFAILCSRPWGICALLASACFGIIKENVVHLWQIILFGHTVGTGGSLSWGLAFELACINIGFTVASLMAMNIFKRVQHRAKETDAPPLFFIGIGFFGALLVGYLGYESISWKSFILKVLGLCACFASQEIANLLLHQFYARCADPSYFNSMQHLLRCFNQLASLSFLQFICIFPQYNRPELFRFIAFLFFILWIILNFWNYFTPRKNEHFQQSRHA